MPRTDIDLTVRSGRHVVVPTVDPLPARRTGAGTGPRVVCAIMIYTGTGLQQLAGIPASAPCARTGVLLVRDVLALRRPGGARPIRPRPAGADAGRRRVLAVLTYLGSVPG